MLDAGFRAAKPKVLSTDAQLLLIASATPWEAQRRLVDVAICRQDQSGTGAWCKPHLEAGVVDRSRNTASRHAAEAVLAISASLDSDSARLHWIQIDQSHCRHVRRQRIDQRSHIVG